MTSDSMTGGAASTEKFRPAVVVTSGSGSEEHRELFKLLSFFGLPWRTESVAALHVQQERLSETRLFAPGEALPELLEQVRTDPGLVTRIHSVFVYGVAKQDLRESLQQLHVELELDARVSYLEVAHARVSGLMAGIHFPGNGNIKNRTVATFRSRDGLGKQALRPILSTNAGASFVETSFGGIPFFLTSARNLIDLNAELPAGVFDIREHAITALPIVLYIKWAFAGICWGAVEANTCLVIDDPLLKQRHGFLDFRRLLELMQQYNFATTIAFIPWNYDRSTPETVALFLNNTGNYSLSIHGCNHTAAEFGTGDTNSLLEKSQRALDLMGRHEQKTGIHHDRIMVFPHGAFNESAVTAVKRTNFIASSSSETVAEGGESSSVRVGEYWDVALMRYNQHAIFTRRSLQDGIENIAFDLLLGKPACIVIHHQECDNDYRRIISLVQRMNALPIKLHWRGLGDALRRSCRQRETSPGNVEVEMYGSELLLENRYGKPTHFNVSKLESEPQVIERVTVGGQLLDWGARDDRITFSLRLLPGQTATVQLRYRPLPVAQPMPDPLASRARTLLRRYLCEIRDNYADIIKGKLLSLARKRCGEWE